MYLLNQDNLTGAKDDKSSHSLGFITENAWVLYTVIAVIILFSLIVAYIIYDLCSRCRESRDQQIIDGGPPATPNHQYSYTFTIRVDEASPSFDTKQTMIKLDLLDVHNQYLTSLAIPSFIFKFKTPTNSEIYVNPQQQVGPYNNNLAFKSITTLLDTWSNTVKSDVIRFYLMRRHPLNNFASIRITHDCYRANAHITIKYITIKEDSTQQEVKVDFHNKQIRAIHPCPPSALQVFHAERPT